MIKGYFGVPGCGKTTKLVQIARKRKNKKRYDYIYTINVDVKGCERITPEELKKYRFKNSLILWDEITMDADNREFKSFDKRLRDFFLLHRHMGCDIIWFTQNYDKVDIKIRDLTAELWYMKKSVVPILSELTISKRIYREININEHTSELTLGYRFCSFLESLFATNNEITIRRLYYKYFDSFDELNLKEREQYEERKNKKMDDTIKYLNYLDNTIK